MSLFIGILSFFLVLICLLLWLLVLVQLPKKEAGMGQAFGGAATDALFGAGSGNALTKMTKILAGTFLFMCLIIAGLSSRDTKAKAKLIRNELGKAAAAAPATNLALAMPNLAAPALKAAATTATNAVAPAK